MSCIFTRADLKVKQKRTEVKIIYLKSQSLHNDVQIALISRVELVAIKNCNINTGYRNKVSELVGLEMLKTVQQNVLYNKLNGNCGNNSSIIDYSFSVEGVKTNSTLFQGVLIDVFFLDRWCFYLVFNVFSEMV